MKPLSEGDGGSASSGSNNGGVGKDQNGDVASAGTKVPGSGNKSGFSTGTPIVLAATGDSGSITRSGISAGSLTITDEAGQLAKTGKTAAETLASLDTTVSTDKDTTGALKPIFDKTQIEAGFTVGKELINQTSTYLDNRGKEIDQKRQDAKDADAKASDPNNGLSDDARQALRDQAAKARTDADLLDAEWGAKGTYRQVATALLAGVSGNVTGSASTMAQGMVINYVQQQGAAYIGKLVTEGTVVEGSPEHAALHAIVACAGAAASTQACSAGALGGAASSLLTNLFGPATPDETEQDKQNKRNLVATLVAGISATQDLSGVATATNAATAAVDNNWLATEQQVQAAKEIKEAKGADALAVAAKWLLISGKQDVLTGSALVHGLADSGWSDATAITQFMLHPLDSVAGLHDLLSKPEIRAQFTADTLADLDAKLKRMDIAVTKGGDENAYDLGHDVGTILWQVGSAVAVVDGVVKGAAILGQVGVNVSVDFLGSMAKLDSFNRLVAKGGLYGLDGKPLMDFSKLTNAQKSVVGDLMGGQKIQQLLPDATKVGRTPAIGQTGIDDLYKVSRPDVDYVIVEYKYGSSQLGKTADGLQMSDTWLQGANTGYNRILESVGKDVKQAEAIQDAIETDRVEKWIVHTDPAGRVTVGIVDKDGKFLINPEAATRILGKK
ncbi:hypothetical protein WG78_15720 [Amantichitinum ursilacus]|uniref:Uncharacterized protein n=2 Tax=Amantichitinum ursilacus TaxID=857265 RepID=A0A0N0XJQ3_9NEIS|nr:hypothetical protein WG78_15720 [Amantichitinum ursilacus]